jgi:hypothetical protein
MSKPSKETDNSTEITEDFVKVIYDLINDILFAFPEFKQGLHLDLHNIKETRDEDSIRSVYEHIKLVFPERFFDILYKNEDMFSKEEINTEFLPGIDFKDLWKADISNSTKETIWRYLQIILFSVIGKVNSQESFGEAAKLFEAINEDELKQKLEETMNNLQNMMGESGGGPIDVSGINLDQLPNPNDIQDHISGILDGKLGKLAKEIAAETAAELNIDAENATSINDVFQNLFKNPGKLMSLVQNVGGKLDSKIKSGEIKESEIMQEASQLLSKMKDIPGMGDIQAMMKKMGMGMGRRGGGGGGGEGGGGGGLDELANLGQMMANMGGLGGGKLNLGAMSNALNQNMKKMETREKLVQRAKDKSAQRKIEMKTEAERLSVLPDMKPLTDNELEELVFSIEGEKPEKSMRTSKVSSGDSSTNNVGDNKNKKNKKKGKK